MKKIELFKMAYALGMALVLWVATTAMTYNPLVLVMTLLIGAVFTWGMLELHRHRQQASIFQTAVQALHEPVNDLNAWIAQLPVDWRAHAARRISGHMAVAPAPVLTPYLVGLLVMMGMLGTFLGMVLTLSGTAFALQNLTDIQGIRVAFSEPIKGLGLAFGASVAGVGTSAMLGFMSTLVRAERSKAWAELEGVMATHLHGHTSEQRREQRLLAIEQHLQAMPELVVKLGQWMDRLEVQQAQAHQDLQNRQEVHLTQASQLQGAWVKDFDQHLRDHLSQTLGHTASELQEMSQTALNRLEQQARLMHEQWSSAHQLQVQQQLEQMRQWVAQIDSSMTQQWGHIGGAVQGALLQLTEVTQQATQAAAGLMNQITQMIQDHSGRDHQLLSERTQLLNQLTQVTHVLEQQVGQLSQSFEQQAQHIGRSLETHIQSQGQQAHQIDEQLKASALEVQALAQSFAMAMQALLDSQNKTLDLLQQTQQTLAQSVARSDEQLAYYVAQAKEVIELSLSAQQPMLQALERASGAVVHKERS